MWAEIWVHNRTQNPTLFWSLVAYMTGKNGGETEDSEASMCLVKCLVSILEKVEADRNFKVREWQH